MATSRSMYTSRRLKNVPRLFLGKVAVFGGHTLNGFEVNKLFCKGGGHAQKPPGLNGLRNKFSWQSVFILRISQHWNYFSQKFKLMIRSTSEQFVVENSKQFNTWILNDFLVRDFCFNDFSDIYLAFLLSQYTTFFRQKSQQIFLLHAIFFEQ